MSDNELLHYGTKRHSGRYPWGSGDEPYQHSGDFLSRIDELKKEGMSEKDIASYFKMSTTDFKLEKACALNDRRTENYTKIKETLKDCNGNYREASRRLGIAENSIRSKINPHSRVKQEQAKKTYEFLKERMKEYPYLDVGSGVEQELNISRTKLDEALYMLKMEGYKIYEGYQNQPTNPGQQTIYKVLCPKDTEFQDFADNFYKKGNIGSIKDYQAHEDGEIFKPKLSYPKSMDSNRMQIRYAEDGGDKQDGLIEIRRGVEDLSLGKDTYSQVRILVDDKYYLKGMAAYSDNMPDGVDIIFNTNKTKDKPMEKVLKPIKDDPLNPFGATIKSQRWYIDENGKEQMSLINKKTEEGDWSDWNNTLPSQFLSKQSKQLAEQQLTLASDMAKSEFEEICAYTNPTVKKKMLQDFAESCDSAAVHLKAASLPRQRYHVILPIPTLKDNEVYAPGYKDGEELVLIRYPHGGTFEIPRVIVNNKNPLAKERIGNRMDAMGINANVAARLSGADFDGDTVMAIPTNNGKIKITTTPELDGLKGFDPKAEYGTTERVNSRGETEYLNSFGVPIKVMQDTGKQMGVITNLITDMHLAGATEKELVRAVKHSMVVIDAEKHKLDYKRSEVENNIKQLRELYQRSYDEENGEKIGGASTLISRAKSEKSVSKSKGEPKINIKGKPWYDPSRPEGAVIKRLDPNRFYAETAPIGKNDPKHLKAYRLADGSKLLYDPTDKERVAYLKPVVHLNDITGEVKITNKTGDIEYRVKERIEKSTKMAETDDARTLVSTKKHQMELIYADYANTMKDLANKARLELYNTKGLQYDPTAAKNYSTQVKELDVELNKAMKNSPRERLAVTLTNSYIKAQMQDNPDLNDKSNKDKLKKLKDQTMTRMREQVGAQRYRINITDEQWEAIQAGAITNEKLSNILKYADMDVVKSKVMPRTATKLSTSQQASLTAKYNAGVNPSALAEQYNVSVSTIMNIVKGKE